MTQQTKLALRSAATVMVVVAMVFAFAISGVRLLGLQVYGVLTGSMAPAHPPGSLVYVRRVDPAALRVNDVITFSLGRGVVATHRIVELVPDPQNPYSVSFRTKGDANETVDSALVSQTNVIGKVVFSLPGLGYAASYIQKPPGMYVAIALSLVLIAFVLMTDGAADQPGKRKPLPPVLVRLMTPLADRLPFLRKWLDAPEAPASAPADAPPYQPPMPPQYQPMQYQPPQYQPQMQMPQYQPMQYQQPQQMPQYQPQPMPMQPQPVPQYQPQQYQPQQMPMPQPLPQYQPPQPLPQYQQPQYQPYQPPQMPQHQPPTAFPPRPARTQRNPQGGLRAQGYAPVYPPSDQGGNRS